MRTLYNSILDDDDVVVDRMDLNLWKPCIDFVTQQQPDRVKKGAIKFEIINKELHVICKSADLFNNIYMLIYEGSIRDNQQHNPCDLALFDHVHFDNCFLTIWPDDDATPKFLQNCNNCHILYKNNKCSSNLMRSTAKQMKNTKGNYLVINPIELTDQLNNTDFSTVDIGVDCPGSHIHLAYFKNVSTNSLNLPNHLVYKHGPGATDIDWDGNGVFLDRDLGGYELVAEQLDEFFSKNPKIHSFGMTCSSAQYNGYIVKGKDGYKMVFQEAWKKRRPKVNP